MWQLESGFTVVWVTTVSSLCHQPSDMGQTPSRKPLGFPSAPEAFLACAKGLWASGSLPSLLTCVVWLGLYESYADRE